MTRSSSKSSEGNDELIRAFALDTGAHSATLKWLLPSTKATPPPPPRTALLVRLRSSCCASAWVTGGKQLTYTVRVGDATPLGDGETEPPPVCYRLADRFSLFKHQPLTNLFAVGEP